MISFGQVLNTENPTRTNFSSGLDTNLLLKLCSARQSFCSLQQQQQNNNLNADARLMQALLASRIAQQQQQQRTTIMPQLPYSSTMSMQSSSCGGDATNCHSGLLKQTSSAAAAHSMFGFNLLRAVSCSTSSPQGSTTGSPTSSTIAPPLMVNSSIVPISDNNNNNNNNNNKLAAARMMQMSRFLLAAPESKLGVEGERIYLDKILEFDVLCGRGGKSNHHAGNKRYRQVVGDMKLMYRKTEAKTQKTDLSRAIVEHVYSYGGRFVKKDEKAGRYYLLTKSEARKKTSQALRETKELKWTA